MTQERSKMTPKITPQGSDFYVFRAAGSDYDIGLTKGREMASDIEGFWDFFWPHMQNWVSDDPDVQSRTADWLRDNLEKTDSWMLDQIKGMADGSGFSIDKILMLNHYGLLWTANGVLCSSLTVRNSDAGPLLGQNLDLGSGDIYFVELLNPDAAYATLSDGMAGMCWSPTGINECGLAVGSSMLAMPSQDGKKPLSGGHTYHFLPRLVLRQCADVAEAIDYLKELTPVIPPAGGYQLNLIDRSGNMAVVDKTGDRTVVRQCEPDMNFTTNFSLDPELEAWRTGDQPTDTNYTARAENIRSLYAAVNGSPTVDWMETSLRGHDGDGRLCRHGDEESGGGYSRLSLVYHPKTGLVEISNGFPCCNGYQTFKLELKADS